MSIRNAERDRRHALERRRIGSMLRGSALVRLFVVATAPLVAGCVTSGAYEAAMREAQTARIAAVRSEAELRALEGTVAALSRRLDAQDDQLRCGRASGAGGRGPDAGRSIDPAPSGSPSNAGDLRPPATRPAPPPPDPRRARKPQPASHRPLDRDDPWGAGAPAASGLRPPADAARIARPITLSKASPSPPLDRDDPWGSAQPSKAPPLDAADPW